MATTSSFVQKRRTFEISVTLTYADTTSAKMFTLPAGTRLLHWLVNVKTVFVTGTTELDIGISSDGDYYVDGCSLAAAGFVSPSTTVIHPGAELTAITDIYMNVGASNTTGEAMVTCVFSMEQDTRI